MLTEYDPSILGRTHDMIEQHRNIVTLVNVPACCHPPPLSKESGRSKLRGMYPAEIQGVIGWSQFVLRHCQPPQGGLEKPCKIAALHFCCLGDFSLAYAF